LVSQCSETDVPRQAQRNALDHTTLTRHHLTTYHAQVSSSAYLSYVYAISPLSRTGDLMAIFDICADFVVIPLIFYIVVAAARLDLASLRKQGWVFDLGSTQDPWYEYYKYLSAFRYIANPFSDLNATPLFVICRPSAGSSWTVVGYPSDAVGAVCGFSLGDERLNVKTHWERQGCSSTFSIPHLTCLHYASITSAPG
jgi:hypothetical protein